MIYQLRAEVTHFVEEVLQLKRKRRLLEEVLINIWDVLLYRVLLGDLSSFFSDTGGRSCIDIAS